MPRIHRLLAALALCLPLTAGAQDDERMRQSTEELERVRARITALQRSLETDRGSKDDLRGQLQNAEQRISVVLGKLKGLRQAVTEQDSRVATAKLERARENRKLEVQRGALGRQVRSAYLIGHQGRTKLLLNQQNPATLSRVMTYYEYLNRARAERIRAIEAQVDVLTAVEARLSEAVGKLEGLKGQQEQALTQLESSRSERAKALSRLERRIKDQDRELKQLLADEQSLQELLESLRDVLADIPLELGTDKRFQELKGRLPWPLRGKLLAGFGTPKAGGKMKWNGLWIGGDAGAPVKAIAHGRVAYTGWMHRYGLIVVVEHDDGYFSLYGHNQSVSRTVGEWLEAGDVIAAAGDTGGHERPGVYFELRKGAEAVDPKAWLAR